MTGQEFRQQLEEFWHWVSKVDAPVLTSEWFDTLEEWAATRARDEYAKECKIRETFMLEMP